MLVAAAAAAYGAGLLLEVELAKPHCCAMTWPSTDPPQAEQIALNADPKALNADLQNQTALAILAGRPGDFAAWLRLAYADRLKHPQLTKTGQYAFETSYLVQPYAGDLTPLRIAFGLPLLGDPSAMLVHGGVQGDV